MNTAKILIVEDENITALDIRNLLQGLGYEVPAIISSGDEAVARAEEIRPDLVLMDVILTGKTDGIEAARRIRNSLDVPVVYLTAFSDNATVQRAKLTEPFGYVLKPFDERDLHTTIEMALYKHHIDRRQRESEERYRRLFELSPDPIVVHDGKVIQLANAAAGNLMGVDAPQQLQGRNVMDFIHPESLGVVAERIKEQLKGGAVPVVNERFLRLDGTVVDVEVTAAPIPYKGGMSFLVMIRDITERLRAENALRESEERYHTLALTIPDPLTAVDLQGNITFVSQRALQFYGYSSETEVLGRSVLEWVAEEDRERAREEMTAVISGSFLSNREFSVLKSDGTRFFAEVSATCLKDAHGTPIGALILVRDVTERRELQLRLSQAQKMEAVGRLAGGIAHDFNNIVGIILGYARLIDERLNPLDPLRKHVQAVSSAAERSGNLTKQLLAFARQQVISPVPVNLNDSLSAIRHMLIRLIGEDIALRILPAPDLWNIRMDPTQLDQILANLATNARDAIHDVGTITIATSNVVFDEAYCREHPDFRPGEFVHLSFRDTGRGMTRETAQKIFEPFFTTKPAGKGTGLGLATVFGIVKQNSGFITVDSEPGRGTEFRIYFPRLRESITSSSERREEKPLSGNERVLVVEDEEQLLELAKSALEMYGYEVLTAKSPGDAVLLCEQTDGKIQLMISDVVMPGMNGRELSERMQQIKPGMKTMYMSGYPADVVANRGILEEGLTFLQKPFTPAMLAKKVREALDR